MTTEAGSYSFCAGAICRRLVRTSLILAGLCMALAFPRGPEDLSRSKLPSAFAVAVCCVAVSVHCASLPAVVLWSRFER